MAGDSVNHSDVHKKTAHDGQNNHKEHDQVVVDPLADYRPHSLNHARYGAAAMQPLDTSKCSTGPKLNDLHIDMNIQEKDTPRRDQTAAEQRATRQHNMPISDAHYQEIAKDGAAKLHEGTFSLPLRNALDEAHKSDIQDGLAHEKNGKIPDHGDRVKKLLEYVNSQLCGSDTTLGREGNMIKVIQTQYNNAKPEIGYYDLSKKDWAPRNYKPEK